MTPEGSLGPFHGRLRTRLAFAIGLALTPLALLSYLQAERVQQRAEERIEVAVLGQTQFAAAPLIAMMAATAATAKAMAAAVPALIGDPGSCVAAFSRIASDDTAVSFAGFVPVSRVMTCSSTGRTDVIEETPGWIRLMADPRPDMTVNRRGQISGESVLIFSHPVWSDDGTLMGFVSISLTHRALNSASMATPVSTGDLVDEPVALMTFTPDGEILTSAFGFDTAPERLPANRRLVDLVGPQPVAFITRAVRGDILSYSAVPVVDQSLFVLGAWKASDSLPGSFGWGLPLWLFPALMWLASLLVAWIVSDHQAVRPILVLRRSIMAFAGGDRSMEHPDLDDAPTEFRDVGEAYERMVESVLHNEAALEDAVHQKEVLLREVHHRVKNNLQLIASIMNIQMRKASSPEAKQIVRGLHDRVMSIATVHRELYQTTGLTDVQADELLSSIMVVVLSMSEQPERRIVTETDFDPIRMTPDQTVPLSLALTEALTNAVKYARPDAGGITRLTVSLKRAAEGRAVLRLVNSMTEGEGSMPPAAAPGSTGLGAQLLQAFATQLSGDLTVGVEGPFYVMKIDFPLRALSEAEARFAEA